MHDPSSETEIAVKLRSLHNFNQAFINGVTGSALKKDNVVKHKKAIALSVKPKLTLDAIFKTTNSNRKSVGLSIR